MKRKIYLIGYAIIQMITSVYLMFNVNSVAKEQVDLFKEMFATMPEELQTMMNEMYTLETMTSSIWLTAIASLVLGGILLWLFVRDRVPVKKGLTIALVVISMVLGVSGLVTLLSLIALVLVIGMNAQDKEQKKKAKKEKNEIKKLRELKVTGKDLLWVFVLVLAYSTQFIAPMFIKNEVVGLIFEILYYVLIFALAFYVFGKRLKRDFKEFKKNFEEGVYITEAEASISFIGACGMR